jgi:putative Mn2+ efflux pump MntP
MLLSGGGILLGAFVGQLAGLRRGSNSPGADCQSAQTPSSFSTALFGLPLSLSLDNLLGGAGISALGFPLAPAALLIGLVSAAMSCAGLYFGAWLRKVVRWRVAQWCLEPAVGAYLCLLAVRMIIASRS